MCHLKIPRDEKLFKFGALARIFFWAHLAQKPGFCVSKAPVFAQPARRLSAYCSDFGQSGNSRFCSWQRRKKNQKKIQPKRREKQTKKNTKKRKNTQKKQQKHQKTPKKTQKKNFALTREKNLSRQKKNLFPIPAKRP